MGLHIVIDGYNLIRQSRRFSELDRLDLQAGREGLLEALSAYRQIKHHKITVVFDGSGAEVGMPRSDRYKGVEVRFSKAGELADSVIKRMAAREGERLLVVSSDTDVAFFAASRGSATIGAVEFEERLEMARIADKTVAGGAEEPSGWRPTTRKRGPSRRLPKKQRKSMQKKDKL